MLHQMLIVLLLSCQTLIAMERDAVLQPPTPAQAKGMQQLPVVAIDVVREQEETPLSEIQIERIILDIFRSNNYNIGAEILRELVNHFKKSGSNSSIIEEKTLEILARQQESDDIDEHQEGKRSHGIIEHERVRNYVLKDLKKPVQLALPNPGTIHKCRVHRQHIVPWFQPLNVNLQQSANLSAPLSSEIIFLGRSIRKSMTS